MTATPASKATLALSLLCALIACRAPVAEAPAAIHGRWTTAAGGFEGRALIITPREVEFETGNDASDRHRITTVEVGDGSDGTQEILLGYEGEGGNEYRLGLIYDPATTSLRLTNRRAVVWRQERAP